MFDFSGDEWLFFLAAGIVGTIGLFRWYAPVVRVSPLRRSPGRRWLVASIPMIGLVLLYVVLQTWADPVYVAGHFDYVLLFLLGGAAWMGVAVKSFPLLGLSVRDDAVERDNPAALAASAGAVLGVLIAYAYSNIGNGPTIWTTLLPAFVATVVLFAVWALAEIAGGRIAEFITVDRDVATGVRLGALLLGGGVVLGRAMAGDWSDWHSTFAEFARLGWPALGLALVTAAFSRVFRPTPQQPAPSVWAAGVLPAALILFLACAYVLSLGAPEVAPPPASTRTGPERGGPE